MRRRHPEIETLEEFDRLAEEARRTGASLSGWQVQSVDLTCRGDVLDSLDPRGALFLGCDIDSDVADRLRAAGALLFPEVPDVPFDPWRGHLYSPAELYDGLDQGYDGTTDARIYAWSRQAASDGDLKDLLATALHDSSVDDALAELVEGRRVVGVMGGHALTREDPAYAAAARLGHDLARHGLTVATGGGPGAMEAANLGARLAGHELATLDDVLARIATVPSFRPDVTAWARVALEAVAGLGDSGRSLGIPTWHYGHEPPNAFGSAVAKYFRNAIREDVLLELCRAGIVFLPGAGGTVQEIFQAACVNYYAEPSQVAPMVFVGEEQWTRTLPAWPLVRALGVGRPFGDRTHLVDDTGAVLVLLG
jgi:predicted Rossmann-fold nucleotide-binding protein